LQSGVFNSPPEPLADQSSLKKDNEGLPPPYPYPHAVDNFVFATLQFLLSIRTDGSSHPESLVDVSCCKKGVPADCCCLSSLRFDDHGPRSPRSSPPDGHSLGSFGFHEPDHGGRPRRHARVHIVHCHGPQHVGTRTSPRAVGGGTARLRPAASNLGQVSFVPCAGGLGGTRK
jgi:hypothetical protein